jgi:hypothetical protein
MENINEEINRISKLMGIDEQRKIPKKAASSTSKKVASKTASQARQSSVQQTAKKKKTTASPKNTFASKKQKVMNDPNVNETLEMVLGVDGKKRAFKIYETTDENFILNQIKLGDAGKIKSKPLQDMYNRTRKTSPKLFERLENIKDKKPLLYYSSWALIFYGTTYFLGKMLTPEGRKDMLEFVKSTLSLGFEQGSKVDWVEYVKNLDNYKVEDEDGNFVGTLKDVLKGHETLESPIYTKISEMVDDWWSKNSKAYPTSQTMYSAMDAIVQYIIRDIDREFNSSLWVNPMKESDPNRKTLKNKGQEYWNKLNAEIEKAKNKLDK